MMCRYPPNHPTEPVLSLGLFPRYPVVLTIDSELPNQEDLLYHSDPVLDIVGLGAPLTITDATAVGDNLMDNGDFEDGTNHWEAGNSATLAASFQATTYMLEVQASATPMGFARQVRSTTVGTVYQLIINAHEGTSANYGYSVGTTAGADDVVAFTSDTTSGGFALEQTTLYFTATTEVTHIHLFCTDASTYTLFDNIELDACDDFMDMSFSFPSNVDTLAIDSDLGGDVLFDSSDSMAPIVHTWEEWMDVTEINVDYLWIGQLGAGGYSSDQSAESALITRVLKCYIPVAPPTGDYLLDGDGNVWLDGDGNPMPVENSTFPYTFPFNLG